MLDILTNDWVLTFLGGFGVNGLFTQIIALTPTKKDDKALGFAQALIRTITGTHGLQRP